MTALREHTYHLLDRIETELLEFVSFIRDLENEYSSMRSENSKTDPSPHQNVSNLSDDQSKIRSSALRDGSQIVEKFLLRIANLLNQFSSLPTTDEKNFKSSDREELRRYYNQYVYRIASYLAKTIQEHLEHFSNRLNELASPLQSDEDEGTYSCKGKNIPTKQDVQPDKKFPLRHYKLKFYSPGNLQTINRKRPLIHRPHKHETSLDSSSSEFDDDLRTYRGNQSIRPKAKLDESSFNDPTDSSSEVARIEELLLELSKLFHAISLRIANRRRKIKDETKDIKVLTDSSGDLSYIIKSLQDLIKLLQPLYSHVDNKKSHVQTEFPSTTDKRIRNYPKFLTRRNVDEDCCPSTCDQCCEICKAAHIIDRKNKEYQRKRCFPGSRDIPILTTEPLWLQSDVKQAKLPKPSMNSESRKTKINKVKKNSAKSENTENTSSGKQASKDDVTQTSSNSEEGLGFSKDASKNLKNDKALHRKSQKIIKPRESPSSDFKHKFKLTKTYDDIFPPGKVRRRISTGVLKPPPSWLKKKGLKKRPPRLRKPSLVNKDLPFGLTSFVTGKSRTKYDEDKYSVSEGTDSEYDDEEEEKASKHDESFDRDLEPLFLKNLKENIITTGKFGGFCLLPGTYNSSKSKLDVLVEKTRECQEEFPRAILFDIEKFSTLLKEKFKAHLEQDIEMSESDEEPIVVLNIVFDSLGEATNFLKEKDAITFDSESDKEMDLVEEILKIAKKSQVPETIEKAPTVPDLKDEGIIISKSDESTLIKKEPKERSKQTVVRYACKYCQDMLEPVTCNLEGVHTCTEKCLFLKSLDDSCSECMNGRQRGLTIHQCHDNLPPGVLEIRHMDNFGKVCVCFLLWNRKVELEDWRWQKNPFHDPTRVEFEQETDNERDAILKVIFGPEGTMLKESLAETQLQTVCDTAKGTEYDLKVRGSLSCDQRRSSSSTELITRNKKKNHTGMMSGMKQLMKKQEFGEKERNLATKLGRLFDDIQKVGYGKGPPLVLKLRRKSIVNDAYDLLAVPSNIRLNYYRSLRVLFVDDDKSKVDTSSTNFQAENEIEELFEIFERELFLSPEKRIFVPPSEETQNVYFNADPNTHPQWFVFAGIVLALAILHQKKLEVRFPICLFKCLLDRGVNIEDLKEIDPLTHQKLMWMKRNDISKGQRRLTFTIKDKIGSSKEEEHNLIVNGNKIVVTEKNKFRYIDLVIKWKLAERCLPQLEDFRRGFVSVIDPGFLTKFTEKELRMLIRNPPDPVIFLKESGSDQMKIDRRLTF